jgi:hypothetical protein
LKPKPPSAGEAAEAIGGAVGGCLGSILIGSVLYSCVSSLSSPTAHAPVPAVEAPRTPLQAAQKNVGDLSERLKRARDTCEFGPPSYDADGSDALDEVDVAMADNIDNVSPSQEQRIRESMGAEMGLSPSQVDGWKDIHRGRAQQARLRLERRRAANEASKRGACSNIAGLERELEQAEQSVQALSGGR